MANVQPAKNTVIIREVTHQTKSGLQAVETGKNKPEIGEVIAIGKGELPLVIKVGDKIIYRKYMANQVYIPIVGEELNFIDFKDIVGVIKE